MKNLNRIIIATIGTLCFALGFTSSLLMQETEKPKEKVQPICIDSVSSKTLIDTTPKFDDLVRAMIWVESRGNDSAYNHRENAAGCLQIRPICVREVNRVLSNNDVDLEYTLSDRWDREKSIEMLEILAEQIDYDEDATFMEFAELVARKWNGGPNGHRMQGTLGYWKKVKSHM